MKKRLFASLIALCMVISIMPITAIAAEGTVQMNGSPYESLSAALQAIPENGTATIALEAGEYTLPETFVVNDGKKITIIGAGEETTKISTSQVCAFQLQGAGAALDLQDVTVSVSAANARVIRLVDNDNMSFSAANVTFETTTPGGNIGIYARGVWEDTSKDIRDGLSITLNNWNYVDSSTTVEQYYSFSVGLYMQEFSSLSLTMQECNVVVDCYAVYFQEKTAAEVKISNSKLQGWAAYYAYSCNTDAVIENSTLTGVNCFEYVEGQYNDFSTIVLDGGELWGKEPETVGYGNDILVKNSTIKAETLKGRVQDIVSCNYNASANKIEFAGCTFETAGKLADALGGEALPALYYSSDASNKIIVDKLSMDTSSEYDLELDPVAKIGTNGYGSLDAAVAAAKKGDTVILLQDISEARGVAVDEGTDVTIDLNGFDVGFAENQYFMVNGGTLNLTGSGTVKELYPYDAPIKVRGSAVDVAGYSNITVGENVTLEGWAGIFITVNDKPDNNKAYGINITVDGTIHSVLDKTGAAGHGVYINGQINTMSGNVPQITMGPASVITSVGDGIYAAGYAKWNLAGDITAPDALSIKCGVFQIAGGTYHSTGAFADPAAANSNGTENTGAALSITSNDSYAKNTEVTVAGGTFISENGYALYEGIAYDAANEKWAAEASYAKLNITGGSFAGNAEKGAVSVSKAADQKVISGGYYTSDVAAYVKDVADKPLASNAGTYNVDGRTYSYHVSEKLADDVKVAEGNAEATVPDAITEDLSPEETAALEKAVNQISGTGLTESANEQTAADKIDKLPEQNEKASSFNAVLNTIEGTTEGQAAQNDAAVTVVIAPRLDVLVEGYKPAEKELALNIQAVYDIKATTNPEHMTEWNGDTEDSNASSVNTVTLEKNAGKLDTAGQEVVISVPLPAGFLTEPAPAYIFVTHTKETGQRYVYKADITGNAMDGYVATFTNPNGFSSFVFTFDTAASIEAGGKTSYYASLQEAVNAVTDGQTITLLKAGEEATVNRTVKFTVDPNPDKDYTIVLGKSCTDKDAAEHVFDIVYSQPSNPGNQNSCEYSKDCVAKQFTDFSAEHWAHEAVDYVVDNGLMEGTSDTTFEPSGTLSRAMLAQVLYNLEGRPACSYTAFDDVEENAWYAGAVNWAAENKIVDGYGDGNFGPNDPIAREQMAAILYRYSVYKGYDTADRADLSGFADGGKTSGWAVEAMEWAVQNKVLTGRGDGTLDPTGTALRSEVAQILMNFCENVAK